MDASPVSFEPVRYGLIGFGRFCWNRLMPAFEQISGSKVVALYKRRPDQARTVAQEYKIASAYGSLEELLADPKVEAVYVTSPNGEHERHAIAAARAGKHVLCEKPLATSVSACRNIINACRKNRVHLMVAHTLRFSPAVKQMKSWMEKGKLGRISHAQALFTYDGTKSPRLWLHDHRLAGGGALMDIGVHCFDTLRYLLGEIVEVAGILSPLRDADPIERSAEVSLRFASGALGSLFCSYESPYQSRLEVVGDRGSAFVESFTLAGTNVCLHLEGASEHLDLEINTGNTHGELIESFSRTVRGLEPVAISGEEGLRNQMLIESVYSGRTHIASA